MSKAFPKTEPRLYGSLKPSLPPPEFFQYAYNISDNLPNL